MIHTKKSLGQHFLRSDRALTEIAGAVALTKDDVVLEIGPGEGVLTEHLLRTGAKVIAVEKDDRLIPLLQDRFKTHITGGQFHLIHGDVINEQTLGEVRALLPSGWILAANIPYYITGLILRTFLDDPRKPSHMVLLVQKEVAEDILARDGKESIGSIAVKVYGKARIVARVPRGAFVPPPAVDSAILHISDIHETFTSEKERRHFFDILRLGFKSKRKTILNTLSDGTGMTKARVASVLDALGILLDTRPERLTVEDWKMLASRL
jgi:16S rRNA (adenine1518-N6/adenine1519-N6)-dimethyltransferase